MASLNRESHGGWRVQFKGLAGKRQTLRLGKMTERQARAVRGRVEELLASDLAGIVEPSLGMWLNDLKDAAHQRLAEVGLVPPRQRINATLSRLLSAFFETVAVKPGTLRTYRQTEKSLKDCFGPETLLSKITVLDADRWRQSMKDSGLAEATISKRVKTARSVFKRGIAWKMLAENPFANVKAGPQTNRSRMHFVSHDDIAKVLDQCPDAEWRLIVALSRYGGLRCPSEHLALRWGDIDWERERMLVRSSKTEGHEGGECRQVPLFPELKEHLLDVYERAAERTEWVITRYRDTNSNLRSQLERFIERAGLKAWPRLFHNLRSSRQTELCDRFPAHVVCAWLGNSKAVAQEHYLQVRDAHFEAAVRGDSRPAPLTQNPTQQGPASDRNEAQSPTPQSAEQPETQDFALECSTSQSSPMTPTA